MADTRLVAPGRRACTLNLARRTGKTLGRRGAALLVARQITRILSVRARAWCSSWKHPGIGENDINTFTDEALDDAVSAFHFTADSACGNDAGRCCCWFFMRMTFEKKPSQSQARPGRASLPIALSADPP